MSSRLEAAHLSLLLTRWLLRVLGAVVEPFVLAVFHAGYNLPLSRSVAGPFVGNNDPWHGAATLEQLAKEAFGRVLIAFGGDQDIQDVAMLVHGSPPVMSLAVDLEEDFIQVSLVARLRTTAAQLVSIDLAELETPLPQGFVGHVDAAGGEEFFDIAVAEGEPEIEPDSVGDNLSRVAVALVQVGISG